MIILFILIQNTLAATQCYPNNFDACAVDVMCEWITWRPSVCHNVCTDYPSITDCEQLDQCYWDEGCYSKACDQATTETQCVHIAACEWKDDACWDQSCLRLQATERGNCPSNYCIWNEKRKLCYDKKCTDYYSEVLCSEISFCTWEQFQCIRNEKPYIQY